MTRCDNERYPGSPFIVRVAGIPAERIDLFASAVLARHLALGSELERDLRQAQVKMVDQLYHAIHGAPRNQRRFFLSVKRNCFSGKPLGRYSGTPLWPELRSIAGDMVDRILALEGALEDWKRKLPDLYRDERNAQRQQLIRIVEEERNFLRGLALASPELVANLGRLQKPIGSWERKEKSLEISLVRYVSRSILKLSPYSTFTRLGIGLLQESLPEGPVELTGADWGQRSLLRVKRYLLDQVVEMLLRYPPVRDALPVKLNDTIERVAPGRYRFFRLGYWDVHPENRELRYFFDSFVHLSLEEEQFSLLEQWLGHLALPCRDLSRILDQEMASEGTALVERLLRLGFLCFVLPWPSNAAHQEKDLFKFLNSWPKDAGLSKVAGLMALLIDLEEGYVNTADPGATLVEIDRILDEMWETAAGLVQLGHEVVRKRSKKGGYYEDVFLLPDVWSGRCGVLRMPEESARNLLRSIDPLIRLSYLHSYRHDFLQSLGAFMKQHWPGRGEVGFLELFRAAQPLWKEARKFKLENGPPGGLHASFNPLGLESIESLRQLKEEIWARLDRWFEVGPEESRIHGDELTALLEAVPSFYAPSVGPCLMLQMADVEGKLWVINRIYEGTGRYASRFTPVMDDSSRSFYTEHFLARSSFEERGHRGEFLELLRPQGDTLNVHAVQTVRVVEFPGESAHLSDGRRLGLADLRVRLDERTLLPVLVDTTGCEYQTLHLGGTSPLFMPTLIKFLAMFGPGEILPVYPTRPGISVGDATVRNRLVTDAIVLQRKRWIFYSDVIRQKVTNLSEEEAFVFMNRWRDERGLPERMFLLEATPHFMLPDRYKPQYIDFTSPLFVALLRSALRTNKGPLVLEEPLPSPDVLPRDEKGSRWAVELQLDSFTLRPTANWVESSIGASLGVSSFRSSASCGGFLPSEPILAQRTTT